jgi:hypothetical protein
MLCKSDEDNVEACRYLRAVIETFQSVKKNCFTSIETQSFAKIVSLSIKHSKLHKNRFTVLKTSKISQKSLHFH